MLVSHHVVVKELLHQKNWREKKKKKKKERRAMEGEETSLRPSRETDGNMHGELNKESNECRLFGCVLVCVCY